MRKHARKTHHAWLKSVDEQSLTRDRQVESKPSTYCVMEVVDDQNVENNAAADSMAGPHGNPLPMHRMADASIAAATACLMPGSMLHPPPMMHHPAMLARMLGTIESSRRISLAEMQSGVPDSNEQSAELDRMQPPSPEFWNHQFRMLLAKEEASRQEEALRAASAPAGEPALDDPLCVTPPMAPSGTNKECLSPFELEEKRPAKMARFEKPVLQCSSPVSSEGAPELTDFRSDPPIMLDEVRGEPLPNRDRGRGYGQWWWEGGGSTGRRRGDAPALARAPTLPSPLRRPSTSILSRRCWRCKSFRVAQRALYILVFFCISFLCLAGRLAA